MPYTCRQSAKGYAGSWVASFSLAFPQPTLQGSLLVAYIGSLGYGRNLAVSDDLNGPYNSDYFNFGRTMGMFSFPNTASGTPTVQVVPSTTDSIWLILEEWPGPALTAPADQTGYATGGTTAATAGNAGTTGALTYPDELCLAMMMLQGSSSNLAVQGPWVPSTAGVLNVGGSIAAGSYQPGPFQSPVTANFTWTTAQQWSGCCVTYIPQPTIYIPEVIEGSGPGTFLGRN